MSTKKTAEECSKDVTTSPRDKKGLDDVTAAPFSVCVFAAGS